MSNVVDFVPHHEERKAEQKFTQFLDRSIQADPESVRPISTETIGRMKGIRKKLDAARQRLFQEEM